MFQTERVPVTVYRSTDEGAPQLSDAPGSLKTVLKACLTNGYGTKQPLGWEMQYEDGHAPAGAVSTTAPRGRCSPSTTRAATA